MRLIRNRIAIARNAEQRMPVISNHGAGGTMDHQVHQKKILSSEKDLDCLPFRDIVQHQLCDPYEWDEEDHS